MKALQVLGYIVDRQKGSDIRISTQQDGENHEVIPNHQPIKPGTLSGILNEAGGISHPFLTAAATGEGVGRSNCVG